MAYCCCLLYLYAGLTVCVARRHLLRERSFVGAERLVIFLALLWAWPFYPLAVWAAGLRPDAVSDGSEL